ncbi:MAG: peptidoglycan editing factor PgeF [Bacteroidales bacterium]|jgi:YfiH family protein|nr:peptidoglycan editing factor PgeF [Bacteroidales bacterium]
MKAHPQHSNLLLFDLFCREDRIVHFTTTREGGVSNGAFSSFNMGNFSDDDPLKIRENRLILARMFYTELESFITPHQTHGTVVLTVDKTFLELDNAAAIETLYGVDATITQEKGIFLCATAADCVPLILFDKRNEVVAAIHAGWRGTAGRIVEKTITEMQRQFGSSPGDMIAGIGPAICRDHYEVGDEVAFFFEENGFDLSDTVVANRDHSLLRLHLDLSEINRRELLRLGVPDSSIEKSNLCTFEKQELFFSARRQSVHTGRMLTGIMLER